MATFESQPPIHTGTTGAEHYSFAREWFASKPPKVERIARQRYRWEELRERWPSMTAAKTAYRRRHR
ncbi:hypothetical protein J2S55_009679 [Streptosporangium brasiliense]|uniref:Uncharacterized protein n=1 Tax=Streptosporangium brasiliense TaxID=47480 RepID=A0ABT9RM19_9ACTN|nr:hypothetical protein [Streptosporangium brasiliense]